MGFLGFGLTLRGGTLNPISPMSPTSLTNPISLMNPKNYKSAVSRAREILGQGVLGCRILGLKV